MTLGNRVGLGIHRSRYQRCIKTYVQFARSVRIARAAKRRSYIRASCIPPIYAFHFDSHACSFASCNAGYILIALENIGGTLFFKKNNTYFSEISFFKMQESLGSTGWSNRYNRQSSPRRVRREVGRAIFDEFPSSLENSIVLSTCERSRVRRVVLSRSYFPRVSPAILMRLSAYRMCRTMCRAIVINRVYA